MRPHGGKTNLVAAFALLAALASGACDALLLDPAKAPGATLRLNISGAGSRASGRVADRARVLVEEGQTVLADTALALPAGESQVRFELPLAIVNETAQLTVTVELMAADEVVSRGSSTVLVRRSEIATTAIAPQPVEKPRLWGVTAFGELNGLPTFGFWLNELGHVAGYTDPEGTSGLAFLWRDGNLIELGNLGGGAATGSDVNDVDQVVGASIDASGATRAFLWENGAMRSLPLPAGAGNYSNAYGINEAGDVTGEYRDVASGQMRAVVWRQNQAIPLGPEGTALGINDAGDVAVEGYQGLQEVGFHWKNGILTVLPPLVPGGAAGAIQVNDSAVIAGWAVDEGGISRPVIWRGGQVTPLGNTRVDAAALDINNRNQVVGWTEPTDSTSVAFLWEGGELIALDSLLVEQDSGWEIQFAIGINDNAEISAHGCDATRCSAILLRPTVRPGAIMRRYTVEARGPSAPRAQRSVGRDSRPALPTRSGLGKDR